jgi:general secretion pathway protein C
MKAVVQAPAAKVVAAATGGSAVTFKNSVNYHEMRKMIEERNIFNSEGKFPDEQDPTAKTDGAKSEAKTFNIDGPCAKSTLNITLVGTIYMGSDNSIATVKESGYAEVDVYKVGDTIVGSDAATVARVERQRLVINNNGIKECLELVKDGAQPASDGFPSASPISPPDTSQPPPAPPPAAEAVAGSDCSLEEKFVRDELGSGFSKIIQKARLVPNTVNNQVNGFKIFAIEPNSLFARAGLQNGDIITQVNDVSLKQPESGFALYQAFQDESEIRISILRSGSTPMMLTCRIKS